MSETYDWADDTSYPSPGYPEVVEPVATADVVASDISRVTGTGTSRSGDVEAEVVGGEVTALRFHPAWREAVSDPVLQLQLAEAVNAALGAYAGRVVAMANADQAPAPELSLQLRDVEVAIAGENPPLAAAVAHLTEVVRQVEQQGFPVDAAPSTPSSPSRAVVAGGAVSVVVDGGQVRSVSLEQSWLLTASDDDLALAVRTAATRAVRDHLAARLEAQVSGAQGADGLASRLYQAQAYVTSALAMKLEGARR